MPPTSVQMWRLPIYIMPLKSGGCCFCVHGVFLLTFSRLGGLRRLVTSDQALRLPNNKQIYKFDEVIPVNRLFFTRKASVTSDSSAL